MAIRLAAMGLAILCGAGCATKFSDAEFSRTDTDIEIRLSQSEIIVAPLGGSSAAAAAAVTGGMIGSLMMVSAEYHAMKEAQEEIAPVLEKLEGFQASTHLADSIEQSRIPALLLDNPPEVIPRDASPASDKGLGRPVFRLYPVVAFSNQLNSLIVALTFVERIPDNTMVGARTGVTQHYEFRWPLESEEWWKMNRAEAATAWNARPTEEITDLIELGIATTVDMFLAHIEERERTMAASETRYIVPGETFALRLWRQDGELVWLSREVEKGTILAVPEHAYRTR